MRLNKYIADSGITSRRKADQLISEGRVTVNGQLVTSLGLTINPETDRVTVDGRLISHKESYEYLILNKPPGYLTTVTDPFHRPTVMELLPKLNTRVYPVGRLDLDTSGLLFFTNDGDLALALTHPRHLVEKVYQVTVSGVPSTQSIHQLTKGILLEDGLTAPAKVEIEAKKNGNAILRITIKEGRKRQVKRMMQAVGHPVLQLHRIAMGPLWLNDLKLGQWRKPSENELKELIALKDLINNFKN